MRVRSALPFVASAALLAGALLMPASPVRAQAGGSGADVERARVLFAEGQAAYAEGRFEEAATKMAAAFEITGSPELAFNLGRVYERMSDYDRAIRFFRLYLRRGSPSEAEAEDVRARIARLDEAKRRQRDQVFTAAPAADELTAEARAFFLRGVAMFQRRHYDAAMQAFIAAQRFAPLPEVLYNMAVTAERLGQRRDAADYYREYLRLRPDAPDRGAVERRMAELRGG